MSTHEYKYMIFKSAVEKKTVLRTIKNKIANITLVVIIIIVYT